MSCTPLVTVVMAVYNTEAYVGEAIDSILHQSFRDFELIVVDDGSTDSTAAILDGYADSRIVRLSQQPNMGLSVARNRAFEIARGKYIAIQDADDVALPHRLARQVEFLESHPEVGVLGSAMQLMDASGKPIGVKRFPASHGHLRWRLCFTSPIADTAAMMRRTLLAQVGTYDPMMRFGQDYDLWRRVSFVTLLANLPDVLVFNRQHAASTLRKYMHSTYRDYVTESCRLYWSEVLGEDVPFELIRNISANRFSGSAGLYQAARLTCRLWKTIDAGNRLSPTERRQIRQEVADRLYIFARARLPAGSGWRVLGWGLGLDPFLAPRVAARRFRLVVNHRAVTSD